MAGATARPFTQALEQLWTAGTCAGLSDAQLLARFLAGRDHAGELAFEVLVWRHGAMVERVCHQFLDDPCDVHDAWQAVFLVLARRAGAIRNRESVGSWLHGVAVRIAKRTKMTAIRHRVRDRRTNDAAEGRARETQRAPDFESCAIERRKRGGRASGNQPASGEVSSADRSALQGRIDSRRGGRIPELAVGDRTEPAFARERHAPPSVEPPRFGCAVGGRVSWCMACRQRGRCAGGAAAIPNSVATQMVKLAFRAAAGSTAGATPVVATSFTLAEGVLKMMTVKKLMAMAATVLTLAMLTICGGVALVRSSRAQNEQAKPFAVQEKQVPQPKDAVESGKADDVDPRVQPMLAIARRHYELQRRLFEGGELPLDRVMSAARSARAGRVKRHEEPSRASGRRERAGHVAQRS